MSKIDLEKEEFLHILLRLNMLQLFDINGDSLEFDFERHICSSIMDISNIIGSSKERRLFGIYAAVYLALVWKTHICKSEYDKKYVLAVIAERDWIVGRRRATPPCVVLNTSARKAVYEHNIYKRIDKKEPIISLYKVGELLDNHNYELFMSKEGDLKIVFEYQE